ncbi:hypothetical protein EN978_20240 [Mesorhizobium sp. M7A.F.Ca.US.001.04.1.1]|nr:hypothetical protein EN979_08155 [Mesorhizobium sp. M7A.F.Ca.US.001.04.2.1]RUY39826.1 hypothetical protein EN978_20240 [Mesorhizobium sp. M7A.F.Ca.US.001.04.1.1]
MTKSAAASAPSRPSSSRSSKSPVMSVKTEYLALLTELDRRRWTNQLAAYRPYLTLPAVSYARIAGLPMPDPADDTTTLAAAFLIGVCAMWISDVLFEFVVRRFKPGVEE